MTRVAWTFIVLSALAAALALFQNVLFFTTLAPLEPPGGGPGALVSRILLVGFLVLSLAMLLVSVGLLGRRAWARPAFIALLALGVLYGLASLGAGLLYPPALPAREESETQFMIARLALTVGVASAALVTLAFGWLILRFSRQSIRDEFESR